MERRKLEKIVIIAAALFVIAGFWFMFGDRMLPKSSGSRRSDSTVMPEANSTTGVIEKGYVVEQNFVCTCRTISRIGVVFVKDEYLDGVPVTIELLQGSKTLAKNTYDVSEIAEQHRTYVIPEETLTGTSGKEYTLRIYSISDANTGIKVLINDKEDCSFRFARKSFSGSLCFSVTE